jgi:hypothetical protein
MTIDQEVYEFMHQSEITLGKIYPNAIKFINYCVDLQRLSTVPDCIECSCLNDPCTVDAGSHVCLERRNSND